MCTYSFLIPYFLFFMYSAPHIALKYLKYRLTASNGKGHGTHSPFVFEFITRVLNDRMVYPEYAMVEELRSSLLADRTVLTVEDLGAGSVVTRSSQRTVSSIAKNAAKSKKLGQLLFRMVKQYQPQTLLELGTSLGITSAYLAKANPSAKLISLEGAMTVAAKAKSNMNKLGIANLELVTGNFDDKLAGVLNSLSAVDFAFIDGNHRREPTERYFRQLLPKIHSNTILVFDDIHWSREMEGAWETIKSHRAVRCTIDLFFIGIVLFREEFHEKQHFCIRF